MQQYQIFWKDDDRPVDDYEVYSKTTVDGVVRLWCSDALRILNFDEVRMMVITEQP